MKMNVKKIYIVGAGYVGLANGLALAENFEIEFIDIDDEKNSLINNGLSPIKEDDLVRSCKVCKKNISASNSIDSIENGSYVVLALPTDFLVEKNKFNTEALRKVAERIIKNNKDCILIIKSTIPVGFTAKLREDLNSENIYFSPEFLREGRSLYDAKNPDRVIVSPRGKASKDILDIFISGTESCDRSKCLIMNSDEAEAVKLFSNTYLAMRVAYFNEIDNFCLSRNLDTRNVIDGMCKDNRIGEFYNNPSFGYGGYCFPKDTKQARATYENIPNSLINAIVDSNEVRLNFLADTICSQTKDPIGIYRLNMKTGSDNIRYSSSFMLLEKLSKTASKIYIYEPICSDEHFEKFSNVFLVRSLSKFKKKTNFIVANRSSMELNDFDGTIFTRDVYNNN